MKLQDKILEYINNDCWKKSFMLSGRWGSGKTTAIRSFLTNYNNINKKNQKFTHYCVINGYEINNEFDLKKYIIKNSKNLKTHQIDPLITGVLNRGLNKIVDCIQPLKKSEKSLIKGSNIAFKTYTGVPVDVPEIGYEFIKNNMEFIYQVDILSKCIVIIDEIDRKQENNLGIIFSKMIDLLENYKMKIIFVINKKSVENENEVKILKDWSEKIFDFDIGMEDEHRQIKLPEDCSLFFIKYYNENKKHFNNYRSYEKYENFEKVIDKNFSHLKDLNDSKSVINGFKEALFYNIFLNDNPNSFQLNSNDKNTEKASSINLGYSKVEIPEFLKLNYSPAFEKIKKDMEHYQGSLGSINKATNIYLKSHYMCHRTDKGGLKRPSEFIISNIINPYKDLLSVDFSTKESYQLNDWIKTVISLGIDENIKNDLFSFLINKIESLIKASLKKEKLSILTFEIPKYEEMIKKYKDYFTTDNDFNSKITVILENHIITLKEALCKNININDDDYLLRFYLNNYAATFEVFIDNSIDFIDDLRKLKTIDNDNYFKMRASFLTKYPNENDRHIKDWMFEIIDGKYENKTISETTSLIKSLSIDENYKSKMFEILKKYNKFDNIEKNNIFNDFKEIILEISKNNPNIILEILPLLNYLGK